MNKGKSLRTRSHAGYSLAEVMVAMAVFTALILAALMIYDRSNRVFNQGVQASDMQQSTRVAFDKLVSDVRLAGFDYDRDGVPMSAMAPTWSPNTSYVAGNLVQPNPANGYTYLCVNGGTSNSSPPSWPTAKGSSAFPDNTVSWQYKDYVTYQQPDEQIEYAGNAAITIRANFDYETETGPCPKSGTPQECENGREQPIESLQFPLVTTDNDEIVTYALVSTTAAANKSSIVFYADTDRPRDVNPSSKKKEAKVTISNVDTTNLNPPYTLYRYTIDKDGVPQGTPIADNIRSLTFQYFTDNAGTKALATPLPNGDGQYDGSTPDAAIPERDARASIKSIRVNLVGMNPNIDSAYTDADTAAPHYRKYALASLVVPRNIGKHGMKEFTTTAPGTPEISTVCTAGCNAVYVTWKAPVAGGDVDSYNILINEGDCTVSSYAIAEDAGTNLAGYSTKATPGKTYRFAVQAVNKYGSTTSSNCVTATVKNSTTPEDPKDLDASGGTSGKYPAVATGVQLYWTPITKNASGKTSMACADGTTKDEPTIPTGENVRYRIYRSKNSSALGTMVLTETSPLQPTMSGSSMMWNDATLPMGSCIPYYYRVQAVTYPCCTDDTMNTTSKSQAVTGIFPDTTQPGIMGQANTTAKPAAPTGVGIAQTNPAVCPGVGNCDLKINWNKVTTDASGNPMFIDGYVATLWKQDGLGNWTVSDTSSTSGGSSTTWFYNVNAVGTYKITVRAHDCLDSDESQPAYWPCDWNGGTINISAPLSYGGNGGSGSPWIIQAPATITVKTSNNIQQVTLAVFNGQTQIGTTQTISGPANSFTFTLPTTPDSTTCKVHITMSALAPSTCVINQDYWVRDEAAPGCALTDVNTDTSVVSYTSGFPYVDYFLKNTSSDSLKIQKIFVTYANSSSDAISGLDTVTASVGSSPKSITANCTGTKAVADFTSSPPPNVAGNQTDYKIRFAFSLKNSNKPMTANPISAICIQYQTPFGDIKTCSIAPNANNCTIPSSACQ